MAVDPQRSASLCWTDSALNRVFAAPLLSWTARLKQRLQIVEKDSRFVLMPVCSLKWNIKLSVRGRGETKARPPVDKNKAVIFVYFYRLDSSACRGVRLFNLHYKNWLTEFILTCYTCRFQVPLNPSQRKSATALVSFPLCTNSLCVCVPLWWKTWNQKKESLNEAVGAAYPLLLKM